MSEQTKKEFQTPYEEYRVKAGYTRESASEELNGISPDKIYRIEKGRYLWLDNNKSIFDGRGVHITLIFGMIVCIFGILSSVKYKYCLWSKASGVINMLCMLFVIILFITQLL